MVSESGKGGHRNVRRARELGARWRELTREQQELAVAHYVGCLKVDSKVTARCGKVSGVVVFLWAKKAAANRAGSRAEQIDALQAALAPLRAGLATLQDQPNSDRARELRSAVGDILARQATAAGAGSPERDLRDLVTRCERGEVSGLIEEAERAVGALHKAWAKTGQQEAQEWVEAPRRPGCSAFGLGSPWWCSVSSSKTRSGPARPV